MSKYARTKRMRISGEPPAEAGMASREKPVTRSQVLRMINRRAELKCNPEVLTTAFSSVGNTWSESNLTSMVTGDTIALRDGNKIAVTMVHIKGVLAVGDDTNVMRIVLGIWDHASETPCATNTLGISNVLTRTSAYSDGLRKKLHDKFYTMVGGSDSAIQTVDIVVKFRKPWVIQYYGAAGGDSQQKIVMSCISDSGAVAHPGFTHGYWALYFIDM